ncbi:MAG: hypothetical protein ACYDCN_07210 [Bacteroidia bacterium]
MKTNQKLILVGMMAAMMQPLFSNAQNMAYKESTAATPAVGWQPVKLNEQGTTASNVQNGVEFYAQKTDCIAGKVTLAKLVNTNTYAVKVSYQLSPESAAVNVLVPAATTLEGSCSVTEGNLGKLIIRLPENADAKQQSKQHLLSHIVVSKNQ